MSSASVEKGIESSLSAKYQLDVDILDWILRMYEWNQCFPQPLDVDIKVWRYMDFSELASLLHTGKLFFSRLDKFDDPFEGSSPQSLIDTRERILSEITADPLHQADPKKLENIIQSYGSAPQALAAFSKFTAVNCWHMNQVESMAMWKLYLSSKEGIAIQSTYRRLQQCFQNVNETINIGLITYINYDTDDINTQSIDYLFMHKRKIFEYENEIRCLVHRFPENWRDIPLIEEGVSIPIDLDALIENVYVAPTSPEWFLEAVNAMITKFGRNQTAIKSSIARKPKY